MQNSSSKLKAQPFFAKAQDYDQVLIFEKAKKAILYRPSTNKLIEVAVYKSPAGASSPSGEVAGTAVTPTSKPTPTKGVSLFQLLQDTSVSPAVTPVPTFTPSPQTTPVTSQ